LIRNAPDDVFNAAEEFKETLLVEREVERSHSLRT